MYLRRFCAISKPKSFWILFLKFSAFVSCFAILVIVQTNTEKINLSENKLETVRSSTSVFIGNLASFRKKIKSFDRYFNRLWLLFSPNFVTGKIFSTTWKYNTFIYLKEGRSSFASLKVLLNILFQAEHSSGHLGLVLHWLAVTLASMFWLKLTLGASWIETS